MTKIFTKITLSFTVLLLISGLLFAMHVKDNTAEDKIVNNEPSFLNNMEISDVVVNCLAPGQEICFDVITRWFGDPGNEICGIENSSSFGPCGTPPNFPWDYSAQTFENYIVNVGTYSTITWDGIDINGITQNVQTTEGTVVVTMLDPGDADVIPSAAGQGHTLDASLENIPMMDCGDPGMMPGKECVCPKNVPPSPPVGKQECFACDWQSNSGLVRDWVFRVCWTPPTDIPIGQYELTGSEDQITYALTTSDDGEPGSFLGCDDDVMNEYVPAQQSGTVIFPESYQVATFIDIVSTVPDASSAAEADGNSTFTINIAEQLSADAPATGQTGTWTHSSGNGSATFLPNANDPNATVTFSGGATAPQEVTWTVVDDNVADCEDSKVVPFTSQFLRIEGTVYDDGNGGTDNLINGTGVDEVPPLGSSTNVPLYANLIGSDGKVVATTTLNPNGEYSFSTAESGKAYEVQISINQGTIGSNAPAVELPTGWDNTGETDGTTPEFISPDGKVSLGTLVANVTGVDFGINQQPVAYDVIKTTTIENPGGTTTVPVDNLIVSDYEQSPSQNTTPIPGTITITTLPDPTTQGILYYDGNPVVAGTPIPNFDQSLLVADPVDGNVTITFMYTTTDAAGAESEPANVSFPLPIDLLAFTVNITANGVALNWVTVSEYNNDFFEIERSATGKKFSSILTKDGKGTSSAKSIYDAMDENPLAGVNYYRLKQIDFDGTASYSSVKSINYSGDKELSLYPNPAGESFEITTSKKTGEVQLRILDVQGREVYNHTWAEGTWSTSQQIGISDMPDGLYLIELTEGLYRETIRFVKAK